MSRMIDRAELFNALANEHTEDTAFKALVFEIIGSMPAVDAEPVVRCKDCVYEMRCVIQDFFDSSNGFCSLGERKQEI